MLKDGLYEQIISKSLDAELSTTDKLSKTAPIDSAEASKVLAKYIAEVVEKGLENHNTTVKDLVARVYNLERKDALQDEQIAEIKNDLKQRS